MNTKKLLEHFLKNIKKNYLKIKHNDEREINKRQNYITKREEIIQNFEQKKLLFNKTNLSHKKENPKNHILIKNYSDFTNVTVKKIKLPQKNLNDGNNLKEFKKSQSQLNFFKKNINKNSKKQLIDIPTKKYDFYCNPFSKKLMHMNKNYDTFLEKYEKIKMRRNKINLEKYQTELLEIGSLNLSRKSMKDLYKNFVNIRKENSVKIGKSESFIKYIEDNENKIYKEISKNEDDYFKILDKFKIKLEKDKLPKIKIQRILKE